MKRNTLSASIMLGLYYHAARPMARASWQLRPNWLPRWAWSFRPVRWLLMRMRRRG
jgi:hypothetical protein